MELSSQKWRHPGGKLRELGPESLKDTELLAILISSGVKGKPAEKIADEILANCGSFEGMANQPLHKFLEIKGLGDVKIIRIAAASNTMQIRVLDHIIIGDNRYFSFADEGLIPARPQAGRNII